MDKALAKVKYFLQRANETSDLEAKLILLNNAYSCFDGLKPAYSLVSMGKEEYQALVAACANDADCDSKCSPAHYDLASFCNTLLLEITSHLQNS